MEQHHVPPFTAACFAESQCDIVQRESNMAVHWEGREDPGGRGVGQLADKWAVRR